MKRDDTPCVMDRRPLSGDRLLVAGSVRVWVGLSGVEGPGPLAFGWGFGVFSYITVLLTFGNVGLKSVFDGFVTLYDPTFLTRMNFERSAS